MAIMDLEGCQTRFGAKDLPRRTMRMPADQESDRMLSKKVQLFPSLGLSLLLVILLTALLIVPPFVLADAPANQEQTDRLVVEQAKVADQYERFKKNITDLADFLRQTDPERAEVLEKAVEQMNRGDAVEHFTEVVGSGCDTHLRC